MAKRSHNVRIDDELWAAAKAAAAAEGRTVTDVIVAALRRLVAAPYQSAYSRVDPNETREMEHLLTKAHDYGANLVDYAAKKREQKETPWA